MTRIKDWSHIKAPGKQWQGQKDCRINQRGIKADKPSGKYSRCPTCGGFVLQPCLLCSLKE